MASLWLVVDLVGRGTRLLAASKLLSSWSCSWVGSQLPTKPGNHSTTRRCVMCRTLVSSKTLSTEQLQLSYRLRLWGRNTKCTVTKQIPKLEWHNGHNTIAQNDVVLQKKKFPTYSCDSISNREFMWVYPESTKSAQKRVCFRVDSQGPSKLLNS